MPHQLLKPSSDRGPRWHLKEGSFIQHPPPLPSPRFWTAPKCLFCGHILKGERFAFFGTWRRGWLFGLNTALQKSSHAYCKSLPCLATYLQSARLWQYYNEVRPDKATRRSVTQHMDGSTALRQNIKAVPRCVLHHQHTGFFIEALFQSDEMLSMRGVPQTAIHGHVTVQLMKPSKSREGGGFCVTFNMACTFYFIRFMSIIQQQYAQCKLPTTKQPTTYTNCP